MSKLISYQDYLNCKITPGKERSVEIWVNAMRVNKNIYESVSIRTTVPWWLIGAIHGREASFKLDRCLHNGDPLDEVTTHVPKGRGPFGTWDMAAIDALKLQNCLDYDFTKIENCLSFALDYNGRGYEKRGLRSPYVWGLTNLQTPGLYVKDHVFDPTAVNKRVGIAAVAKFLGLKNE